MIEFFTANWLWIAFIAAVVVMHRSGHGCGMHGGHHHSGTHSRTESRSDDEASRT